MDSIRWTILLGIVRRFALPAIISALVLWLGANGLSKWIPPVCSVADAIGIIVVECEKQ